MKGKSSQNTTVQLAHISATRFEQAKSSSGWPKQKKNTNTYTVTFGLTAECLLYHCVYTFVFSILRLACLVET